MFNNYTNTGRYLQSTPTEITDPTTNQTTISNKNIMSMFLEIREIKDYSATEEYFQILEAILRSSQGKIQDKTIQQTEEVLNINKSYIQKKQMAVSVEENGERLQTAGKFLLSTIPVLGTCLQAGGALGKTTGNITKRWEDHKIKKSEGNKDGIDQYFKSQISIDNAKNEDLPYLQKGFDLKIREVSDKIANTKVLSFLYECVKSNRGIVNEINSPSQKKSFKSSQLEETILKDKDQILNNSEYQDSFNALSNVSKEQAYTRIMVALNETLEGVPEGKVMHNLEKERDIDPFFTEKQLATAVGDKISAEKDILKAEKNYAMAFLVSTLAMQAELEKNGQQANLSSEEPRVIGTFTQNVINEREGNCSSKFFGHELV
ncbi:MAG: hypothetical protein O3C38_05395 [Proteobacteria bacterium]|nr:hypothetical protein [Pseudomonadota bacterium]